MKAYSVDLRQRVVAAVDTGTPRTQVAATFGVGLATIKRWLARRRDTGELAPTSPSGRQPTITPEQHAVLWAQLEAHRDATLDTHAHLWNEAQGAAVSQWTVGRAIRRLGWTRKKKTLGATERDEPARRAYRERVQQRAADEFVVMDECGTNLDLTPRFARAPRGARALAAVPRHTPANTTLLAAMTAAGMGPAMTLAGAADTAAVEAYVEHFLAPTLTAGQVVVMDNLAAHKRARVRELIEARGCQLWYLPTYSPDLSPIEEAFAKLKELLRRAEARTREALHAAIAQALEQITAQDARSYFAHCGYGRQAQ